MPMRLALIAPVPLLLLLCTACASNPYGYAPEYVPLSDEETYFETAIDQSYEDIRRDPSSFVSSTVSWFGIVDSIKPIGHHGQATIALTLRFHQPRHLCTDQFDSSCRVTISEKEGGPFSVLLTLREEDIAGKYRVYEGSLLRVYGKPVADYDERGGPILKVEYYRHWPLGTYVTVGRRANMRR
jgi:hypothetical protein